MRVCSSVPDFRVRQGCAATSRARPHRPAICMLHREGVRNVDHRAQRTHSWVLVNTGWKRFRNGIRASIHLRGMSAQRCALARAASDPHAVRKGLPDGLPGFSSAKLLCAGPPDSAVRCRHLPSDDDDRARNLRVIRIRNRLSRARLDKVTNPVQTGTNPVHRGTNPPRPGTNPRRSGVRSGAGVATRDRGPASSTAASRDSFARSCRVVSRRSVAKMRPRSPVGCDAVDFGNKL